MNKIEEAKRLNKELAKYDHSYFTENVSLISDEEYDNLWFKLRHLLEDNEVKKALSKTDMSIGVQSSYLSKVTHAKPVLSLDKEKIDDFKFKDKLKNFVKNYETNGKWTISEKLDGLTLVTYKQNDSGTIATRGASVVGENVSHQFMRNQEVMKSIDHVPNGMMIRGEGIISKANFESIIEASKKEIIDIYQSFLDDSHYHLFTISNEDKTFIENYLDFNFVITPEVNKQKKDVLDRLKSSLKGYHTEFSRLGLSAFSKLNTAMKKREKLYTNSRNLASASVRMNDTKASMNHNVEYVVYDIMNSYNFGIKHETDVAETLKSYGFKVVKQIVVTTEELFEFFKDDSKMNEWRELSEYDIDGLVIKPDLKIKNPPVNGHHEKGQLAVKFKSKGCDTVLREVVWNVTSNGRYAPVAIFDEITIDGSTICRASLASWNTIQKLDIKIGDVIRVVRSNDVIPKIVSVDYSKRTGNEVDITLPENSVLKGGIVYTNNAAEPPLNRRIQKFMKRLNAKNIGIGLIDKLIDNGYVESIADMFLLSHHVDSLKLIKGLGQSKVESLIDEVELIKDNMTFKNIIFALGIEGLGKKAIEDIIDVIPDILYFKQITKSQVENAIETFGMTQASQRGLQKLFDNPDDLFDFEDLGLIKNE